MSGPAGRGGPRTGWRGTPGPCCSRRCGATVLGRYADGLAAGAGGAWPPIEDHGRPPAEAASIALALRLTRPLLRDRLDDAVRQRAVHWLRGALHAEPGPGNVEVVADAPHDAEIAVRRTPDGGPGRRFRFTRASDGTWPAGPVRADEDRDPAASGP